MRSCIQAMQHHTRRGDRDPGLWNDAADYAINPILADAGFTLPGGLLNDPKFRGMTAEQIYDSLNQPQRGGEVEEDQDDSPTGGGQEEGEADPNGGTGDDNTDDAGGDSDHDVANKPGAVFDAPDPAQQEAEWQVALKQATQAAQMMGQLPGGIAQAVEQATKPRIDWEGAPTAFRPAVCMRRLLLADAESQVHRGPYLPAGAALGVHAGHRGRGGYIGIDIERSAGLQGGASIDRR